MKINFKIWFILLLIVGLNKLSIAQTNLSISGKLNYQQTGTISIVKDCLGVFSSTIATTDADETGKFYFKFTIIKPQVIRLFNRPFYITPGDSVSTNITGGSFLYPEKLEFKGRNVDPYIYAMKYDSLKTALNYKFFEFDFKNRLLNYLDLLNANKIILLDYLNEFSLSHTLSDNFKTYALNQIIYDYYSQLLSPFITQNVPVEQVPLSYSTIIDQIKLTYDSLADKMEYVYTAINLIKYKKHKLNESDLQLINDNSTGLTKEILLTHYAKTLVYSYTSKDSAKIKELFEKIDWEVINPEIRKYFNPLKEQLNKYLTPFPTEVLLTALIDSVGLKLSFKDLIAKSKNKIIVLDFWASWCGPCKIGMPKVNNLKKIFSNSDVEFVFISIDETENEWRHGMMNTLVPGNHYWIVDKSKSALGKYLQIHFIPRYVIINKASKIEKIDAYGPELGDYGLMTQLTKLISH